MFVIISVPILLVLFTDTHDRDFLIRNISNMIKYSLQDNYEVPNRKIDVLNYNLKLDIFHEDKYIKEVAKLKLLLLDKRIEKIELDFYDNFKINFVKLNNNKVMYDYYDNKIIIDNKNGLLDTLEIEIDFEGIPENLGIGSFWIEEKKEKYFLATLNEPIFASTWFPCNDTPADKATVQISITNDSSIVSLSNGKLDSIVTIGSRRTYIWKSAYTIAPYLISIYSGKYKHFSQKYVSSADTMDIDYYVTDENYENAKWDFKRHPEYLEVLSNLFGEYPFIKDKYGVVEIFWSQGAMESQTITGLSNNFISGHNFNEAVLVHELAHHWWGNSVTPKTWKDIWLTEGFATYTEALYYEKTSGVKSLISTMDSFKKRINPDDEQTLYNPGVNIFSSTVYNKGAWVLHMLRREIGDSLFFDGLKAYQVKYQYSNVNTADVKHFFESFANRNFTKFFDQWVYEGKGFLKLKIGWDEELISNKNYQLKITIEQIQNGYENYHFPLDIEVTDSSGVMYSYTPYITNDTILVFTSKSRIKNMFFDKDNWLLTLIDYGNSEEK